MTAPQASPVTQGQAHTPGPWKVIETNYLPFDGDHVADMSNGLMVVPTFLPLGRLGDPLSDARLIAAAPDLLAALLRCKFDSLNMTLDDLAFCRAAILKATGAAS